MKPIEYIRKYNLKHSTNFNHKLFIDDLANDFVAMVEFFSTTKNWTYNRFKLCIADIKQKFDSITYKSIVDINVFEKLWKYFYATVVIKIREDLFGEYLKRKQTEYEQRKRQRNYYSWQYDFDPFAHWYKYVLNHLEKRSIPTEEFKLLGLSEGCTIDDLKNAYREKALIHHPDKGGKQEDFIEITRAKNICFKYLQTN